MLKSAPQFWLEIIQFSKVCPMSDCPIRVVPHWWLTGTGWSSLSDLKLPAYWSPSLPSLLLRTNVKIPGRRVRGMLDALKSRQLHSPYVFVDFSLSADPYYAYVGTKRQKVSPTSSPLKLFCSIFQMVFRRLRTCAPRISVWFCAAASFLVRCLPNDAARDRRRCGRCSRGFPNWRCPMNVICPGESIHFNGSRSQM